jgi:hypothetical protein
MTPHTESDAGRRRGAAERSALASTPPRTPPSLQRRTRHSPRKGRKRTPPPGVAEACERTATGPLPPRGRMPTLSPTQTENTPRHTAAPVSCAENFHNRRHPVCVSRARSTNDLYGTGVPAGATPACRERGMPTTFLGKAVRTREETRDTTAGGEHVGNGATKEDGSVEMQVNGGAGHAADLRLREAAESVAKFTGQIHGRAAGRRRSSPASVLTGGPRHPPSPF